MGVCKSGARSPLHRTPGTPWLCAAAGQHRAHREKKKKKATIGNPKFWDPPGTAGVLSCAGSLCLQQQRGASILLLLRAPGGALGEPTPRVGDAGARRAFKSPSAAPAPPGEQRRPAGAPRRLLHAGVWVPAPRPRRRAPSLRAAPRCLPRPRLGAVNQHFPAGGWHRAAAEVPPPCPVSAGNAGVPPRPQPLPRSPRLRASASHRRRSGHHPPE